MSSFPAVAGFEVFEYPGAHLSLGVGESYARVRLEELHSRTRTVSASTNAAYLLAGRTFRLTEHPIAKENAEYLVVSASCTLRAPHFDSGDAENDDTLAMFAISRRYHMTLRFGLRA